MLSRRSLLLTPLALLVARERLPQAMTLALHQNTSAGAGYRGSLEGWAKAGIRTSRSRTPAGWISEGFAAGGKARATDNGLTAVSGAAASTVSLSRIRSRCGARGIQEAL